MVTFCFFVTAFPLTVVIVQRSIPDRLRGRVFTVIISAHNAILGVGMVAAGAFTVGVGPRWTYVIAAASLAAGSLTAAALLPLIIFSALITGALWKIQQSVQETRFSERVNGMSIALDRELQGSELSQAYALL